MAERVHVSSLQALAQFRSRLLIYLSKAQQAINEAGYDVKRTRQWMSNN